MSAADSANVRGAAALPRDELGEYKVGDQLSMEAQLGYRWLASPNREGSSPMRNPSEDEGRNIVRKPGRGRETLWKALIGSARLHPRYKERQNGPTSDRVVHTAQIPILPQTTGSLNDHEGKIESANP